jgi:LTXXQ motif family protein
VQRAIRNVLRAGGVVAIPAALLTSLTSATAPNPRSIDMSFLSGSALAAAVVRDGGHEAGGPVELAQAMGPPSAPPGPGAPGGFAAPFGPPPHPPGMAGMAHPAGPPPSPRMACEEEVDRLMGLAGYLKSKLSLKDDQKDAWLKVEQVAVPAVEKIRNLCARLPLQPAPPPHLLEHLDFVEMQTAARLELLRTVHEPLRAFFETLSPDQRAILETAPHHLLPMPPFPPEPRR